MIDIRHEQCFPLKELRSRLPVRRSYMTLWRYVTSGILSKTGKTRIKMESVQVGNEIHSSSEAFYRFIEKLNEARQAERQQHETVAV